MPDKTVASEPRKYPEGMCVDVTFSPTLQRFYVAASVHNGEELFGFSNRKLSIALDRLAEEIRSRYE